MSDPHESRPGSMDTIYIWFVIEGGDMRIRKWDFFPFENGVPYDMRSEIAAHIPEGCTVISLATVARYREDSERFQRALQRIAITDDEDCAHAKDPEAMKRIARSALRHDVPPGAV